MNNPLNELSQLAHQNSKDKGFWNGQDPNDVTVKLSKIALMHSELSEALEGARKNLMDDKLPHRLQEEVELADALIRIFDFAGARGFDLDGAVREKMAFNSGRPYMHGKLA